jgi:GNAT superfamily N-acetyltransferase
MAFSNYYIKRSSIYSVPYWELAALKAKAYRENSWSTYLFDQQFPIQDKHIEQIMKLSEPTERLKRLTHATNVLHALTLTHEMFIRLKAVESNTDIFLLYERGTDKLIGSATYSYPNHSEKELRKQLGKNGVVWTLYVWWQKLYTSIGFMWLTIFGPLGPIYEKLNTLMGRMMKAFTIDVSSIEQLSGMSYEELKNTYYPNDSMYEISQVMIDPDYQRRGLGEYLVEETMKTVPCMDTPFTYNHTTTFGPQKFRLVSSTAGLKLYPKLGFTTERAFDEKHDEVYPGFALKDRLMMLTRE